MATPVIMVHGGAWTIPDNLVQPSRDGTKTAARAGYKVLESGGSALDAVQAAVMSLEDDPTFDAGKGSVLNKNGEVEMDAVIMDGQTLKSGGVACVQNIKNPICLAREVMQSTDHCLLVGPGANQFAEEVGIKKVPMETLVSDEAIRELECYKQYGNTVEDLFRQRGSQHDTVGAVAMDCHGNIAYGTSTGGITCKKPGRVGDSPIMGAGGYADNEAGAVSCTGHGESIFKVVLAYQIITLMKQGMQPQEASDKALAEMSKRVHGYGGVIVLSNDGQPVTSFTTERMAWAWAKDGALHHGVDPGEDIFENIVEEAK
ncbi:Isoaspartyl peptidase/L-asparaginase [Mactra antiquata]